ncbi:MAG TPA: hypothetical protein VFD58_32095 [Blastocatellia bacterium]|nr:hypothetical protein [Blastocatellia bacterium]
MHRFITLTILLSAVALAATCQPAFAQTVRASKVRLVASDPATCNQGDIIFNTTSNLLKSCGPANTWTAAGGGSVGNPTATIGLTAVNGSASTAMRSDGAPALSQAIAPVWTGAHVHTPSSDVIAVAINQPASATVAALNIIGGGTPGANAHLFKAALSGGTPVLTLMSGGQVNVGNSTQTTYNFSVTGTSLLMKLLGSGTSGSNASPMLDLANASVEMIITPSSSTNSIIGNYSNHPVHIQVNHADAIKFLTTLGQFSLTAVLFANLGTPADGTFAYCSDCVVNATCAGSGTGAFAKRLNGAWVCN